MVIPKHSCTSTAVSLVIGTLKQRSLLGPWIDGSADRELGGAEKSSPRVAT